MMLTEVTALPQAVLPVAQFRDHLRLGSGFDDDALQDGLIETYLRAAIAAIEARIGFMAGFGPDWSDLPADLAQAALMLAAHFYENRNASGRDPAAMPFGVAALLERYRTIRLFVGGRA
jgi:hypothetical protein